MSRPNNPKCEVCRTEKGVANHWFCSTRPADDEFSVVPAYEGIEDDAHPADLCGESCAHKALSQWFAARGKA